MTRFIFHLVDDFFSRTFYILRISRWQLLNFLFIFYDIFLKLNIVNFVCVCLKKEEEEGTNWNKVKVFLLVKDYIFLQQMVIIFGSTKGKDAVRYCMIELRFCKRLQRGGTIPTGSDQNCYPMSPDHPSGIIPDTRQ